MALIPAARWKQNTPILENYCLKKIHHVIELFFEFAQLKNLYRQGWLQRGIAKSHCESVADHSFGVALLGYILAEEYRPDLNSQRVMQLGLFHELGEIYAGDITPKEGVTLEDKFTMEYAAVQEVFSGMPNPERYITIWMEYEKKETPEAIFVEQVDRLEMVLQASLYKKLGFTNLDEFFPYVRERINSPELKPILDGIMKSR